MSDQDVRIAQIRAEHERQGAIHQMAARLFEQAFKNQYDFSVRVLRQMKRESFKAATIFYELPKTKK